MFKLNYQIIFNIGDIIKNKFLKLIIFTFILLLCTGIVCASENNTICSDDNSQTNNIKELIDECDDNGVVNLDDGTYCLNDANETHIILNKTITVQGTSDKAIIDGNNTSLFLDVNETNVKVDSEYILIWGYPNGYVFKYLGKNVTFKNIIFKDLKMTTWHEMTFENCKFINTTFTSYEYGNTFTNCSFNKSKVEIVLFFGYDKNLYKDYSKIINCSFYESMITYKGVYTRNYIAIIGGDQFRITNKLNITNSKFYNSNITQYQCNITIDNSSFYNSNIMGRSSIYNITNTNFNNQKIELSYSTISIRNSNLENPKMELYGGYFSKGCDLSLENTVINNCNLETAVSYGSRTGSLKVENSTINNSTLNLTDTNVLINDSLINKTLIEFFFSDANIINSTFANDGEITDTIKTRNYNIVYTTQDNEIFAPSIKECQVKTNYTVKDSYFVNSSGKFAIKEEDINMDTTHKITVINERDSYNFNDKLIIKVEDYMGNPVNDLELSIEDKNNYVYPTPVVKTDKNGTAEYTLNKIGNSLLKVYYQTEGIEYRHAEYGIDLNLTVLPTVSDIKVSKINFATNTYSTINSRLDIKTIANESASLKGLKYAFKVYTNGKAKTYYAYTDNNGKATFKIPKTLTAGAHKIEIILLNTNIEKTMTVKIAKAKTTVKAPKVTNKYKKSKLFKVTVKNKANKKAVSNVKVKIKVYTGKKYKKYTVKTNSKGIGKINTKTLKVGKHKVVISSGNSNYKILAKSTITIKK